MRALAHPHGDCDVRSPFCRSTHEFLTDHHHQHRIHCSGPTPAAGLPCDLIAARTLPSAWRANRFLCHSLNVLRWRGTPEPILGLVRLYGQIFLTNNGRRTRYPSGASDWGESNASSLVDSHRLMVVGARPALSQSAYTDSGNAILPHCRAYMNLVDGIGPASNNTADLLSEGPVHGDHFRHDRRCAAARVGVSTLCPGRCEHRTGHKGGHPLPRCQSKSAPHRLLTARFSGVQNRVAV
jgi:hypothetical protein